MYGGANMKALKKIFIIILLVFAPLVIVELFKLFKINTAKDE